MYKKYEHMKESGIEWIGEIPEHWLIDRIKYSSYVKGRIGWQGLRADEFIDEGPYLITGMHFNNDSIDWEKCYHISDERYNEAPEIHVRKGDILITKDGTIGKIVHIKSLPGKASLNSHLLLIRPLKGSYIQRHLFWYLSSQSFKDYAISHQTGTTFGGITQEKVVNLRYTLPPLPEQQAIAAFLDRETARIDTLIDKKERLIALLKEKRQALITRAVTKGLDPDVEMKDSGVEWIGDIPAHWDVRNIKYLFRIVNGSTPQSSESLYWKGDITWITPEDLSKLYDKFIRDSSRKITELGYKSCGTTLVPANSIILSTRAPIGHIGIASK